MPIAVDPARTAVQRIAPFAGVCVLAWVVVPLGASILWWEYWLALGVALVAATTAFVPLALRRWSWLAVVPSALLLLAAVGLLRDSGGGLPTGAGALAILPVFQTALYSRSRRDLAITLAGVALFFLLPIWIVGAPDYPQAQYRTVLLAVAADAVIGLTVQRLVGRVRHEAGVAQAQTELLERVSAIVDGLFDNPQPRARACDATLSIGRASVVLLYEFDNDPTQLVCTESAGLEQPAPRQPVPLHSPAYEAIRTGRPFILAQDVGARVGLRDLWNTAGSPRSVMYQPLVHRDDRLGVLIVGWPEVVSIEDPRSTAIALLAHEAAAVISRADLVAGLSDAALTDELTGLPNRRAWQQQLAHAFHNGRSVTIGMLDLDHFKEFNDTRGHPVGDLLLKETATAWRDQLRSEDFLARIGGEEFGLLLCDCESTAAAAIVARLREVVAYQQTCSAGIAELQPAEKIADVIGRADQALYEAKASGRDATRFATVDPSGPRRGQPDASSVTLDAPAAGTE